MALHEGSDLSRLVETLKRRPVRVREAAAKAVNNTAALSVREALTDMTRQTTLSPNYVKRHLRHVSRASVTNLRAVVHSNARGTPLGRYAHYKTQQGVAVKVSRNGGYTLLPQARILRSSGAASAIALPNRFAVNYFKRGIQSGQGRTPGKSRKLQRVVARARSRPYGVTVLHSRSINQMFVSTRETIQPALKRNLSREFRRALRR